METTATTPNQEPAPETAGAGGRVPRPATNEASSTPDHEGPRWWRDSRRRWLLAAVDLFVAEAIGIALVSSAGSSAKWALLPLLAGPVLAKLLGLYDADHRAIRHSTVDELPQLTGWVASVTLVIALAVPESLSALVAVGVGVAALLVLLLGRGGARMLWRYSTPRERTLVLGEGEPAHSIARKIELFEDMHLELVGTRTLSAIELSDRSEDPLERLLAGIDRIVLAWAQADPRLIERLIEICRRRQIKLSVVSPYRGKARPNLELSQVAELPVLEYNTWDVPRSTMALKRGIDATLATIGLLLAAPLMVAIAVGIKATDRGSILFRQQRAGEGGVPFQMLKFRSMRPDAESRLADFVDLDGLVDPMFKLNADPRVTPLGHFLRRTSLDELPQLINVLRGQMSIVGPRPEEMAVVDRYRPEHRFRLSVKPGLTGPMQVFGRGDLTFQERLAVELDYVENLSLQTDLKILLHTPRAVTKGDGAF